MRQALECCHRGWGESVIIGVAGALTGLVLSLFADLPAGAVIVWCLAIIALLFRGSGFQPRL